MHFDKKSYMPTEEIIRTIESLGFEVKKEG